MSSIPIGDDFAEIHADTTVHLVFFGQRVVLRAKRLLSVSRTAQRLGQRGKLREDRIPRGVNDGAAVAANGLGEQVEIGAQPAVGAFFIATGEAAIAGDIGIRDGSRFSR